jgi:hypothetical protein
VITASAARRALRRKARRAELRRQIRAAVAVVAREESAEAELVGEAVEVRYMPRSLMRALRTQPDTPETRIERLCSGRECPCGVCEAREAILAAGRELRPGEVSHTPESIAVHDAETTRELALWDVLVWRPEAAAVAARFRADDRPGDSAWARLRLVLEALGVLSPLPPGPLPVADRWLEVCPSHGPPALTACPAAGMAAPEALVIPP